MQEELEAFEAVSRAIDNVKRIGRNAELTLSNGIVLNIKSVPPYLIQAVTREFKEPTPPKVMMEEKGREEENPNDPSYLRELQEVWEKQALAINDLYLAVGTSVKSVPEGYYRPEDDEWIDQVIYAGNLVGLNIEINRDDKIKRYLHWVRFYACETGMDAALAQGLSAQLAGIRQDEVEEVMESFRRPTPRAADREPEPEEGNQDGDNENRASRRRRPRN